MPNADPKAPPTDPTKLRRHQIVPRFLALLLLAFLAYPIVGLTDQHPLLFLALIGFAGGYVWVIWRNTPQLHTNQTPLAIAGTIGCGSILVPTLGPDWFAGLSFFASVMLLINFPQRWWRVILPLLILTSVAIAVLCLHMTRGNLLILILQLVIGSGLQVALYRQLGISNELRQARIELTQLAVTQERLRIARDLHDILGQRLSAISLKAQIAARVVASDPQRAALEMTEVGALARDGLAAARAAVSGYRQISLGAEAASAEALLTTAGLRTRVRLPIGGLPAPLDECAGWVVREAVTNALRHARAGQCEIAVTRDNDWVTVEVCDDGVGAKLEHPPMFGIGLTGLSERVAMVGGRLSVESRNGSFCVRARMPIDARTLANPSEPGRGNRRGSPRAV